MSQPRVVCVSGSSSGLGRELAAQLAGRGETVYGGFRDLADAPRLPKGVRPLRLDVTRTDDIAAAAKAIEREAGRLDVLINNAGAYAIGPWEVVPDEVLRRLFEVNFFGAVALTKAMLPLLRRHGGRIVIISSLSGLVARPTDGAYAASKFALEGFAESLAYEVRRWNIKITIVNPGGYATDLMRKAWLPPSGAGGPYEPLLERLAVQAGAGNAESAAQAILAASDDPNAPLRNAIDDMGRKVFRTLGLDRPVERDALVRSASGVEWWIDGAAPPPKDEPAP